MFDKQSSKSGHSDLTAINSLAHHDGDIDSLSINPKNTTPSKAANPIGSHSNNDSAKEFQAFSVEFDEIDNTGATSSSAKQSTSAPSQPPLKSESVFAKELRACDFQLTYMKREYKKE